MEGLVSKQLYIQYMDEGELLTSRDLGFFQVLNTENLTLAMFKSNYKLRAAKAKGFHLPFLTSFHFQDQSFYVYKHPFSAGCWYWKERIRLSLLETFQLLNWRVFLLLKT